MKKLFFLILCVLLIPCVALAELTVYFLDVGQGDCAIIECDGEAMIIDGGLPGQSSKVYSFIESKKAIFTSFEFMIATHPDNDHIGGLPAAIQAAARNIKKKVNTIYSPVKEHDSPRFADLQKLADENHAKIKIPYDKDTINLGKAKVTFYNCNHEKKNVVRSAFDWVKSQFRRDDPEEDKQNNDMSLVVKIVYGDTSFLFTGDIETDAEGRLLSTDIDLNADVLKVAHHGSSSSSSPSFLEKVNPKHAVISCGKGNRYRHPHQQTLDELKNRSVDLYRTDLQGMITCHSDGHDVTFETEKTVSSNLLFISPEKNQ